ncbi:MAG: RDD family protein [Mycobacteriales bacterium]
MARWTGTWLEGPGATLGEIRRGADGWLGKPLGLPREGENSIAPFSTRALAFVLDILASSLVGALITSQLDQPSGTTKQLVAYGVLFVEYVLGVALLGQTFGMRLMGLKVLRLKDVSRVPGVLPALLRTLPLLLSIGLAGFFTREGRGFHDLAAGTVVVRA